MPRQLQGADMLAQDCRACWLSLLRVAFQARRAPACPSSDGGTAAVTETSVAAVAMISMVKDASSLGERDSMARL